MSNFSARLLFVVMVTALPALAQKDPATVQLKMDRRAALVEVIQPESAQSSPAAIELLNRQVRKHVLLFQHPALIEQVMKTEAFKKSEWIKKWADQAPGKFPEVLHVQVIPDTNIIELKLDANVGEEAATLLNALVKQHLENQRQIMQNKQLERSVMLNNLKQRYQFRKDELGRDLREKAVQLSIDGMGMPGRLSAKEVELTQLLTTRFELERKKLDKPQNEKATIDGQIKLVNEKLDATKADLGALTNAMNQYLTLKDDEQKIRELLQQVNQQLEQIFQRADSDESDLRWLAQASK
jgi:hypothetical protein